MLFNIVIFFILTFTGIMCLTINRSRAYQVKDEIITIIEENQGLYLNSIDQGTNNEVLEKIVEVMQDKSYRTTSVCPSDEYFATDRNGNLNSNEPSLCIKQTFSEGDERMSFYTVILFYRLDIPILREFFNFQIKGETKLIYEGA